MLAAIFLLAAVSPHAVPPAQEARPMCRARMVPASAEGTTVHRLNQEPPAELLYGVLRLRDGCEDPMVIRHDVGAPPSGRAVAPR